MKITEILKEKFPTNDGYLLKNVTKIKKDDNTFALVLEFQRVENAKEILKKNELRSYYSLFNNKNEVFITESNVAFLRLFAIGSIWMNSGNNKVTLPTYFLTRTIFGSIFKNSTVKELDSSEFNFGNILSSKHIIDGEEVIKGCPILHFEFDEPYYLHKDGQLRKRKPGWNDPTEVKFIAFPAYEIYRYFYGSYEISDLNERLLRQMFSVKENVYDEKKSVNVGGDNIVYLRYCYDQINTSIIGNIIYDNNFLRQLNVVQNQLNVKSEFDFDQITSFPISDFSEMTVSAMTVYKKQIAEKDKKDENELNVGEEVKKDKENGLLVFFIQNCKNYTDLEYTSVCEKVEQQNDSTEGGGGSSSGTRSRSGGGTKNGNQTPRVNNSKTSSMGAEDELLNIDVFKLLLEQDSGPNVYNGTVRKPSDGTSGGFGGGVTKDENEKPLPPGSNPDSNGKKINQVVKVEPSEHFLYFKKIIEKIDQTIKEKGFDCDTMFLNQLIKHTYDFSIIDLYNVKDVIKKKDDKYNHFIVLATMKIKHKTDEEYKYFYLFEKAKQLNSETESDLNYSSGRTWLYSTDSFSKLRKEDITKYLEEFCLENKTSDLKRLAPDYKFNHKNSKRVQKNSNEPESNKKPDFIKISKDEAIENQVRKISDKIISYLNR